MSHRFRPVCWNRSHLKTFVIAVAPDSLTIELSSTLTGQTGRRGGDDPSDLACDEAPAGETLEITGAVVGATSAFRTLTRTVPSQMPRQSLSLSLRPPLPGEPPPAGVCAEDAAHIHPVGAK
jgi:hypothetical protein